MNILVTGGCGFIGSNFIIRLMRSEPGVKARNVDLLTYAGNLANLLEVERDYPERYSFSRADIADISAMRKIFEDFSPDAVVNFAAESHVDRSIDDPTPFIRSNIQGVQCLLMAAREHGVKRFVHVSTDEVYGSLPLEAVHESFTEQTPLAPNSPYSASKASADLLCRAWRETYDFPVIITRCSNNYGPYQFPEKLIPLMYACAMKNQPLPVYGDGQNVRDWIHVSDHCRGVLLALKKGRPGAVYNLGGNAERRNLDVVKAILRFCGKDDSLISFVKDRPGHDRRYAMNFSLARRELGFEPEWDFERGLADALSWYRDNQQWMDNVASGAYRALARDRYGDSI